VHIEPQALRRIVRLALEEDIGPGDITSQLLIPDDLMGRGRLIARSGGVIAGLPVAALAFELTDARIAFVPALRDGEEAPPGAVIATVNGPAGRILTAERTALNFLQRLSGIATLTARAVSIARPFGVDVLDTRKTAPGLRLLDKYAVRCGGGKNHRLGLFDAVLIKDNHVRMVGDPVEAVRRARRVAGPTIKVELETTSLDEIKWILEAARGSAECLPDIIMLDNMTPELMRRAVSLIAGKAKIEASGGVTLDNLAAVAATGVDYVSLGALTHSVRALDISLEVETDPAFGS
jgi:nicotinate-nucleotide pyrophosphorylase (carboxylating)